MRIGLFGKLPAKGDFVTRAIPAEVLQHWETWLERVVSGAKHHLAHAWEPTYEAAPVWRFWVGETVFGHPVAGAFTPSRDRVGRRFPLLLLLTGDRAGMPAPPLADSGSNAGWYDRLEAALLEAKGEGFGGDVDALIQGLPLPDGATQAVAEDRRYAFFAYGEAGLGPLLQDVRDHDHQLASAGRSYWWTGGNAHVGPAIIAEAGLPDASSFAAMLTGFGPPPTTAPELEAAPPPLPADDMWGSQPDSAMSWEAPAEPEPELEPSEDITLEDSESPFGAGDWDVPTTPPTDLPIEEADTQELAPEEPEHSEDADADESEPEATDTERTDVGDEDLTTDAPEDSSDAVEAGSDLAAETSEDDPVAEAEPAKEDATGEEVVEETEADTEPTDDGSMDDAVASAEDDGDESGDVEPEVIAEPDETSEEAVASEDPEPEAGEASDEDTDATADGIETELDADDETDEHGAAEDKVAPEIDTEDDPTTAMPEGVEDDDTSPFDTPAQDEKPQKRRLGGLFSLGGRKR